MCRSTHATYPQNRLPPPPREPTKQRRHSPKGKASGWIEERLGNLKRQNPSTSYYYCWQQGTNRGKQYIPVRKLAAVQQMIDQRCSMGDILAVLAKDSNTPIGSQGNR
ncbi:hypothetical protein HJG54_07500 [Leptolyngbya sp. NK1-12]|uniref:Uncharacterized protein n=1 Tax=Leptolyngbya sp. NK1-12 TaxID=2547451 RepID=A0AA96WDS1_9CYAN|nr:hypothetical protein [Leptolyngbya sp. NK1-12]WNZ22715.1 hypothetical protein HJG54_07500 [Leptolyngbya sp. NK1-12]